MTACHKPSFFSDCPASQTAQSGSTSLPTTSLNDGGGMASHQPPPPLPSLRNSGAALPPADLLLPPARRRRKVSKNLLERFRGKDAETMEEVPPPPRRGTSHRSRAEAPPATTARVSASRRPRPQHAGSPATTTPMAVDVPPRQRQPASCGRDDRTSTPTMMVDASSPPPPRFVSSSSSRASVHQAIHSPPAGGYSIVSSNSNDGAGGVNDSSPTSPMTTGYEMPSVLLLRKRRRGTPHRKLWKPNVDGWDDNDEQDVSSLEGAAASSSSFSSSRVSRRRNEATWNTIQSLSPEQQLQAYWKLVYPHHISRPTASLVSNAPHHPKRKGCFKVRPHPALLHDATNTNSPTPSEYSWDTSKNSPIVPLVHFQDRMDAAATAVATTVNRRASSKIRFGPNCAAEFDMHRPCGELTQWSPSRVAECYPHSPTAYDRQHPIDESLVRLTKENAAILAVWDDDCDDDNFAVDHGKDDSDHDDNDREYGRDIPGDGPHRIQRHYCFEDKDDGDDDPVEDDFVVLHKLRRRSPKTTPRNLRRESGLFVPCHDVATTSTPLTVANAATVVTASPDLPLLQKLSLHSPGAVAVGDDAARTSLGAISPQLPAEPMQGILTVDQSPATLKPQTYNRRSSSLSPMMLSPFQWQQKLAKLCSSPIPSHEYVDPVASLDHSLRKLAELCGTDGVSPSSSGWDTDPEGPTWTNGSADMEWLQGFDSCTALRHLVQRNLLTTRAAVSLMRPTALTSPLPHRAEANEWFCETAGLEWQRLELQLLEKLRQQISTSLLQVLSHDSERLTWHTVQGLPPRHVEQLLLQEEESLRNLEGELQILQCENERLRRLQLEQALTGALATRCLGHVLRALMPFDVRDTDGEESLLFFPTPIQGLEICVVHRMDGTMVVECQERLEPNNSVTLESNRRIAPDHACATFYKAVLPACFQNIPAGREGLNRLELSLGRLERACWDLYSLSNTHPSHTIEEIDKNSRSLIVTVLLSGTKSFQAIYDCNNPQTLSSYFPSVVRVSSDGESDVGLSTVETFLHPGIPLVQFMSFRNR